MGPDAFTEVRYLANDKQLEALRLIPDIAADFKAAFGRDSGGLLRGYRTEGAETLVVALGSVNGTIKEVVDVLRADGAAIGSIALTVFRPFPLDALRAILAPARRVVVVEKSFAPCLGGVLASNVRMALRGMTTPVDTVIAGLGGRPILMNSLRDVFEAAAEDRLPDVQFLDLDHAAVEHEIVRARGRRRSGPTAAHVLRHKLGAGE